MKTSNSFITTNLRCISLFALNLQIVSARLTFVTLMCFVLEMDNLPAIQIFAKTNNSITVCHGLIMDIRRILSLDWEVKIQHVYREGNRAADRLANLGSTTLPLGYHLVQETSKDVYEILKQDIIGVSFCRMCN